LKARFYGFLTALTSANWFVCHTVAPPRLWAPAGKHPCFH
jgi:hypothetical protein